MKTGVIIQARMGSSRLAGKVMKDIKGKSILEHVIERVRQSEMIDEIIIATTTLERDDVIESEVRKCGVQVYRGSEDDVLSRYYEAATENGLDTIIRITSDCPLIDPHLLDAIIRYFNDNQFDIVTNAGAEKTNRTYPRGLDVEVFSFAVLEDAYQNAKEKYQREHVTPYIYESSDQVSFFKNDKDYSMYRWTLDTEEDFNMIKEVYSELYHGTHDFYFKDIIELMNNKPYIGEINAHIEQKKIK